MNRNDEKALKNKKEGKEKKKEREEEEGKQNKKKKRKERKSRNHGNGFTFFHQFFFDRLPLDTSKCISYLSDVSREKEISADLLKETKIPVSIFHNTERPPFVPVTYYPSMLGKFAFISFLSRFKFYVFALLHRVNYTPANNRA